MSIQRMLLLPLSCTDAHEAGFAPQSPEEVMNHEYIQENCRLSHGNRKTGMDRYLRRVPGEAPRQSSTCHDGSCARVRNDRLSWNCRGEWASKISIFFEKEIFGLNHPIEKLVEEYFHSAARRLDVRKRILLLMGPVSGGKSTIVTMLKRGWSDIRVPTKAPSSRSRAARCMRSRCT